MLWRFKDWIEDRFYTNVQLFPYSCPSQSSQSGESPPESRSSTAYSCNLWFPVLLLFLLSWCYFYIRWCKIDCSWSLFICPSGGHIYTLNHILMSPWMQGMLYVDSHFLIPQHIIHIRCKFHMYIRCSINPFRAFIL